MTWSLVQQQLADLNGLTCCSYDRSFGALIALAYVERYAKDVRGLVLVDPLVAAE